MRYPDTAANDQAKTDEARASLAIALLTTVGTPVFAQARTGVPIKLCNNYSTIFAVT